MTWNQKMRRQADLGAAKPHGWHVTWQDDRPQSYVYAIDEDDVRQKLVQTYGQDALTQVASIAPQVLKGE